MAFRNKAVVALAPPLQMLLSFRFSGDCHLRNSPNVCCPSAAGDRIGTEQGRTMAAPSDSSILDQCPGRQGAKLQTHLHTCSLSHLFKHLLSICYGLCIALDTREARQAKARQAKVSSLQDLLFVLGGQSTGHMQDATHSPQHYVEL